MAQSTPGPSKQFDRTTILALLREMNRLAEQRGEFYEIAVYGGSALILQFDWRERTHDIDYTLLQGGADGVQRLAIKAATNLGLPTDGVRDDVRLFASDFARFHEQGLYPDNASGGHCGLRVLSATPEYLLAMKVLSLRPAIEYQDCWDVWNLVDECDISSHEQALEILEGFYPGETIDRRKSLILGDLLQAKANGADYSPMLGW